MSHSLSFLDKTFWLTESTSNPKHVGAVQLLEMPEDAQPKEYIEALTEELRQHDKPVVPFNCRIKAVLGYPLSLQPVNTLDMHYHVQSHLVENIYDKTALDNVVAKMHETRLDKDKPLWQYHVLHDGRSHRYAIYLRLHHAYGDGATMVRWFQAGYADSPDTPVFKPIWAVERKRNKRTPSPLLNRIGRALLTVLHIIRDMLVIFVRLFMSLLRINRHYMPIPFSGTRTVLTGQVKAGRAVATMNIDFDRVQKLGKRTRASANEVLLCAFDIGVHRLLQDYGHTFKKALLTNVPINLRKPGETTGGNKIAIVPVKLAYGKQDPFLRLRQIIYNHRIVKNAAQRAHPGSFSYYTIVIQSFALLFEWLHLSDYFPPIANILVSNVPGPDHTLYLKDSKLIGTYPVSTMTPGGGVNITLLTYNGVANIGFVCCSKKIQDLQPLAKYVDEAFTLLEQSVDDPTLSIEDIGEHDDEVPVSIVSETIHVD